MKVVEDVKGMNFIVDKSFKDLSGFYCSKQDKSWYAKRTRKTNGKRQSIYLHRFVIGAKKGQIVDHINGNTLDNRSCNLRIVDASESNLNRRKMSNRMHSKFTGVGMHVERDRLKPWVFNFQMYGKKTTKYFSTKQAAEEYSANFHSDLKRKIFGEVK
jgi:hypothetical protein